MKSSNRRRLFELCESYVKALNNRGRCILCRDCSDKRMDNYEIHLQNLEDKLLETLLETEE